MTLPLQGSGLATLMQRLMQSRYEQRIAGMAAPTSAVVVAVEGQQGGIAGPHLPRGALGACWSQLCSPAVFF